MFNCFLRFVGILCFVIIVIVLVWIIAAIGFCIHILDIVFILHYSFWLWFWIHFLDPCDPKNTILQTVHVRLKIFITSWAFYHKFILIPVKNSVLHLANNLLVLSFAILVFTYAFDVKAFTCSTPARYRITEFNVFSFWYISHIYKLSFFS